MALSPKRSESSRATKITKTISPSKTYALDFETGKLDGMVDGKEAIRQFIRKALATPRYRHLIYDSGFGSELEDLIEADLPLSLLRGEVARLIREALIYDARIRDVRDFSMERDADALYVSFVVDTVEGSFNEEVTL